MTTGIDRPMLIRGLAAGTFVRGNGAFYDRTGLSAQALSSRPFLDWIVPEDRAAVDRALADEEGSGIRARHITADGDSLVLEIEGRPTGGGMQVLARGLASDNILGMYGEEFDEGTVTGTLETIARIVEDQNPGYRCSILLKNEDRFARGAGPSLPEDYNAAIDGEPIGPGMGSCGTAIYWGVPVVVEDIQTDPLWTPFRAAAAKAGVAACWSHPFTSSSGNVLGALALYASEPEMPTEDQLASLRAAARMTGLAVERGRAEEALRQERRRQAELEEQLRQAAKMEALGVLAGGVAHDFNNLLTTISGNAEVALRQLPVGHPARQALERILRTSHRAGDFSSQMLAYAGRGTMRTGEIELSSLLSELSDLANAALSKKAVLSYALHPTPIWLEGDENQLLQVALNLVTNAAEAIGDQEGTIEVSTGLEDFDRETLDRLAPDAALEAGRYARLTVRDDGQGMDAATRARIFDPFFTTKFTGRGLGLAAVTGMVRRHAGFIEVSSTPGIGTTFQVYLPAGEDCGPTPATHVTEGATASRDPIHVLVVDDEDGPRQVFRLLLEGEGCEVTEAVDGAHALRVFMAAPESFDCVLLDQSMPRLGGLEVFRRLRALCPGIPVVLVSGFNEEETLHRLDGARLARALQKPIPCDRLIATIRGVIAERAEPVEPSRTPVGSG